MSILVTGATGLVGSRLLPRLIVAGHDCRALVRPGRPAPGGVAAAPGDILDASSLAAALDGVTDVLHLAAVFRTPDADAIRRANVEGTANLITAVKEHAPGARFTMASTGLVYASGLRHPAREEDPTTAPAPYPASKAAAESLVTDSGLTYSILRFGYVYGDGDGHLEGAPGLLGQWKWHPAQALSLIHHRDIATAVELALAGSLDGHTVNVVDDAPTTIAEIARLVGTTYPDSSDPLNDPWLGRADGTLARSLGFVPTVPTVHHAVREGLL